MATPSNVSIVISKAFLIIVVLSLSQQLIDAQVGVSYGQIGDNLPSPQDVVNLYKSNGIKAMRLYFPDQPTLQALQGSGITLILGVANENIQGIASCQCQANKWVQTNVVPYGSSIKYIAVGNEIKPSDPQASSVLTAMQYILNALNSNNLGRIKVSLAINFDLIENSYPPSHGQFTNPSYMTPIINFLTNNNSPLLVNIYPFIAYQNDPTNVPLDYALFRWSGIKFYDDNGLGYQNLFDAMVDAVYAAISKIGGYNVMKIMDNASGRVKVVTSESGWSSKGGFGANLDNAGTYYRNLANHVNQGTPLTRGQPTETYLFAMFDEDKKDGPETERNFGLFYPNQQSKYGKINF